MKFFGSGVPDQYYAVTARIAARGHQRTTMRAVAGSVLVLGLPAILAAGNPPSSDIPGGRVFLAIVPLACAGLAGLWLRHRWPTRAQSTAFLILGAVLLAAGCIVTINPLAGLLTATAFSLVLGYAALFHSTTLQVFAASVAGGTILWLGIKIAMTDVPTALAVTSPVIVINAAALLAWRMIADVSTSEVGPTDVEPLTGLLTMKTFDELAATMVAARDRVDDRFLVLIVAGIDSFAALLSLQGRRVCDRARLAAAQALRDTVRRDALLSHVDESEFLIADTFTIADPTPLAERIRSALAALPGGVTVSIGVVSKPLQPLAGQPPNQVVDRVIALATATMLRARRRGGNQIEYLLNPSLDGPAEPGPDPGQR